MKGLQVEGSRSDLRRRRTSKNLIEIKLGFTFTSTNITSFIAVETEM
jgi:hypothetical protein